MKGGATCPSFLKIYAYLTDRRDSSLKMKKTDIGVVGFMYAVCAFFYVYSFQLSEESKTYPIFTIILLFALTTLYLIQMILSARKFGVESGVEEIFKGFKPLQFALSIILTVIYFFLMKYLGFFTATTIFMIVSFVYLKVPVLHSAIAIVAINLLIYLAFVKFLGVRLPAGFLI